MLAMGLGEVVLSRDRLAHRARESFRIPVRSRTMSRPMSRTMSHMTKTVCISTIDAEGARQIVSSYLALSLVQKLHH